MYSVDTNSLMNWAVGIILAIGVGLLIVTVVRSLCLGKRSPYLNMLTLLFACFAFVVGILGFRGQTSGDRPWHFLLDMKYQPKYTAQGESEFFADGRSMQLPPSNTIPFDGTDFSADAGFHMEPKSQYLKADGRYYRGIAEGIAKDKELTWRNGQLIEGYYVGRIPDRAVNEASGWESLINRGKLQFNVQCAACHGTSGRGGSGTDAHGIVGAYKLSIAPADVTAAPLHSQPDGQLFHTIGNGKGQMPGYGHQVKVQDRWAIVAYIRVLQFARK